MTKGTCTHRGARDCHTSDIGRWLAMTRRWSIFFLIFALLLSACGKQEASVAENTEPMRASSETVENQDPEVPPYYSVEYVKAGQAFSDSREAVYHEGRFLCTGSDPDTCEGVSLYWAEPDAGTGEVLYTAEEDFQIDCFCIGGDGIIYFTTSRVVPEQHPAGFDNSYFFDGYGDSSMIAMDFSGEILWETELPQTGADMYSALAVNAAGEIYLLCNSYSQETGYFDQDSVTLMNQETVISMLQLHEAIPDEEIEAVKFITGADGTIYLEAQIDFWPKVYGLNMTQGSLEGPYFEMSEEMEWPTLSTDVSGGVDYYTLDGQTGLTGHFVSGESHQYFTWKELPATVPEYARFLAVTGEYQWLFRCDLAGGAYFVNIVGSWEPYPESEKTRIVFGVTGEYIAGVSLSELAVEYNILNPDYELVLKYYVDDSTYKAGTTPEEIREQLNRDILNGEGPDILMMGDYCFPCSTYAGNGFLTDLYPLMDADPEFDRSEYFENIWELCAQDGKLYGVMPSISLRTMITNTDTIPVENGWTPTECKTLVDSSGIPLMLDGYHPDHDYMNNSAIAWLLGDGLGEYIDGNTCNFVSGEFATMLELLKTEYIEYEYTTVEDYRTIPNGRELANQVYIYMPENLLEFKWKYGENYQITGYPSPSRSRLTVSAEELLGISAATEHAQEAWEVVKMVLEAVQGNNLFSHGISTHRETLMEELQSVMTLPENYSSTYSAGDESVDIPLEPLTREEVDEFLGLMESIDGMLVSQDIRDIAVEEAASFFSGEKTAQQVAELIQNRVQICLWENS